MNAFRPLILIPSYNTGAELLTSTVESVLAASEVPVWVVIDGSNDDSERPLQKRAESEPRLNVLKLEKNRGKGAAILHAAHAAVEAQFTHALVMDSDGQHPASHINPLIDVSRKSPRSVVMGQPVFGPEAPAARLWGRKLTIWWTNVETLWGGLGDTLFGMRVYPLKPLTRAFRSTLFARGFDFDPEIAVRLYWQGLKPVAEPVPCRYLNKDEGGVSHFHYLRDNIKLTFLHLRLLPELLLFRLWLLPHNRRKWAKS